MKPPPILKREKAHSLNMGGLLFDAIEKKLRAKDEIFNCTLYIIR